MTIKENIDLSETDSEFKIFWNTSIELPPLSDFFLDQKKLNDGKNGMLFVMLQKSNYRNNVIKCIVGCVCYKLFNKNLIFKYVRYLLYQ